MGRVLAVLLAFLGAAAAFAPARARAAPRAAVAMSASVDRRAALAGALGALVAPAAAQAVVQPTDGVYYGKPNQSPDIGKFAAKKWLTVYPEKRVTLEKKSPYDRIDLSPPLFSTYHKVRDARRASASRGAPDARHHRTLTRPRPPRRPTRACSARKRTKSSPRFVCEARVVQKVGHSSRPDPRGSRIARVLKRRSLLSIPPRRANNTGGLYYRRREILRTQGARAGGKMGPGL